MACLSVRSRSKPPNPTAAASRLASANTSAEPSALKGASLNTPTRDQVTPDVASKPKRRDLWQEAFQALQKDEEKSQALVEFQRHIISSTGAQEARSGQVPTEAPDLTASPISDEAWRDTLRQYANSTRDKMAGHARGDERIAKILDTITLAKDTLAFAASFEPHAAMVWTGMAAILPVKILPYELS
jgi:N-terminal domain of NWD NACHT-NTPase